MDYQKLFQNIEMPEYVQKEYYLFVDTITETDILEMKKVYARGNECFENYVVTQAKVRNIEPEKMNLYMTLCLYENAYEIYKRRGTDEKIIYATAKNIADISKQYADSTGIYGIPLFEIPWFRYHLDAIIFQLGRLQYQIAKSEYEVEIGGVKIAKGESCFFVHIPRGEPLTPEICEESYRLAYTFFKVNYSIEKMVCFCYSWLFQPWLREVLSEGSNIIRFQKSYKVLELIESVEHAFRFIFPQLYENIDDYPINNKLQRVAIERKKCGESIGYGVGIKLITEKLLG